MRKIKFKKGDWIKIIAGKYKGIEGSILKIIRDKNRVIIEGITNFKHIKPSQNNSIEGIQKIPASIDISNIMLIDPKNKKQITKIGYKIINNKKNRIAKKSKINLF